jgi:hypothetical protein
VGKPLKIPDTRYWIWHDGYSMPDAWLSIPDVWCKTRDCRKKKKDLKNPKR